MRFNALFQCFQAQNFLITSYFPWNIFFYLLTAKSISDINNYLLLVQVVQELCSSLHVRHDFWCLIMASIKLN